MAVYLLWEMKTGNSKVYISVYAGQGINTVTLSGRTSNHISGYYTKGSTLSVSCTPASGYLFDKWLENGSQIGSNNPTYISASRNRSWIGVGRSAVEAMIAYAENEIGNYQVNNSGYNIGNNWCAAFSSWCAYMAGLASNTYSCLQYYNGGWHYYKNSDAYAGNYTHPIQYLYQVLRNAACTQQIAHFCRTGHMYVSNTRYKSYNSDTQWLDWTSATVYSTYFTPQRGDFVYFDWSNTNDYGNHVGIVTSVTKNGTIVTITTIEGNINGTTSNNSNYYDTSTVGTSTYQFDLADQSKLYKSNGDLHGYIIGFGRVQ